MSENKFLREWLLLRIPDAFMVFLRYGFLNNAKPLTGQSLWGINASIRADFKLV
jgi:hypothetical protein